ncbi:MAG: sugar phosphate isomerase/epimerase family protein [Chloroflexota bacterium]
MSLSSQAAREGGHNLPRLSLNTITIRHASLADKFRFAAEAGFRGLELWGYEIDDSATPDQVRQLAARHGLVIEGICPQPDLYRWHCSWDQELEDLLHKRCALYGAIGAHYLVLPVMSEDGTEQEIVDNLARAGQIAARYGLAVALEPIGHVAKLASFEKAFAILDRAQAGQQPGIVLDVFHFYRGRNHLSILEKVDLSRVLAVHLDDAEPLPLDELVGYRHRLYPGEGQFDVRGFVAKMSALGYRGPYVVELLNERYWNAEPRTVAGEAYAASARVLTEAWQGRDA